MLGIARASNHRCFLESIWHTRTVEILFGATLCRRGSAPKARLTDNGPWFFLLVFFISDRRGQKKKKNNLKRLSRPSPASPLPPSLTPPDDIPRSLSPHR